MQSDPPFPADLLDPVQNNGRLILLPIFSENDHSVLISGLHGSACWPARGLPSGLHQATGQTRCRPLGRQACARQGCRIAAFERVEKILSRESLLAPDSSQILQRETFYMHKLPINRKAAVMLVIALTIGTRSDCVLRLIQ